MSVKLEQDKKSPQEMNCQAGFAKEDANCGLQWGAEDMRQGCRRMIGVREKAIHPSAAPK
jgi:hypothetical protein